MKSMTMHFQTELGARASLALLTCCVALTAAIPARAGIFIPNKPVDLGGSLPPNVMMILDDSGSMGDDELYDERVSITGGGLSGTPLNDMRRLAHPSNTLSYNPTIEYKPWVKADTTLWTDTPYTAVYTSDSFASGTTTSLLAAARTFYTPKPTATNLQNVTHYFRYSIGTDGRIVRSERIAANDTITNLLTRTGLAAVRNTWVNGDTGATAPLELSPGVPAAVIVPVPASASLATQLKVEISGGDANANLYVRFNALPTTASYDCRPNRTSSGETCTFDNPAPGTWYVGVRAADNNNSDAFASVKISVDYTTADPERGTVASECDNTVSWGWRHCEYATPTVRNEVDERKNYATWYSFYRTRMKSAKAGVTRAFSELGGQYRVGFAGLTNIAMRVPVGSDGGLFRDVGASTNRTSWYNAVTSRTAGGWTPLRGALRRVGDYFAETGAGNPYQGTGSVELACRQNFAILTTDGYWNNNAENYTGAPGHTDVSGDEDAGATVTGPSGATYTYAPIAPYLGATEGTLADVAMHFWKRDLRTDLSNIVPVSNADPAFWQHVSTFGISLGLRGDLAASDWPGLRAGTVSWPVPFNGGEGENIDDLWHAAVNGRGSFVAATSPQAFADALRSALAAVVARTGSSSNVSANSASFSSDTRLFQARYVSNSWIGEVLAYPVDASGVSVTPSWVASDGIPAPASRTILTWDGSGGAIFPTPTQAAVLNAPTAGVTDFLLGDRTQEISQGGTFRNRVHLLGDIINSSPYYSKESNTIFIGANDGMLHAFNATSGAEVFAYVPGKIDLTALKSLASDNYAHSYFVDGPVVVSRGDQSASNRNYLVGSLGRGGKGVFGLDVTAPAAFGTANVLWDFDSASHDLMGNVIGRPIITKLNNGDLGVIVPNGPNSVNDTAVLYVLNVSTGAVIAEIDTGVGGLAAPNGLSSPRGWDDDGDGDVDIVYAGDLLGNFWRFDLSSASPASWTSATNRKVLYAAKDSAGNFQAISGSPSVAIDPDTFKTWVFFGTGRMLNNDDIHNPDSTANLSVHTWYGLMDENVAIASRSDLQQRKIVALGSIAGKPVRGFEPVADLPLGKKGWFIDLVTPPLPPGLPEGERIVGDSAVVGTTLLTASVIPNANECGAGGRGYINALHAFSGASVHSGFFDANNNGDFTDDNVASGVGSVPVGSIDLGVAMPTSPTIIENLLIAGGSSGTTANVTVNNPANQGRISWREVIKE